MWRRLASPLREFGWRDGALYLIDRLLRGVSPACGLYLYDLVRQPIGREPLLSANRLKNLRFAEVPRGHPDIDRMPARAEIKARRFEQAARCLGVYRNDVLIAYVWLCFDAYEEDEVRCTYRLVQPDRSVFDFDLYVFPEHRMGTAFTAVWHGANTWLRERGIEDTFSRVTRFNLASRRSHAHLKAARVGVAAFLKLWRVEIMMASVAPWFAVTWSPAQRVQLRLAPRPAREPGAGMPGAKSVR